VSDNSCAVKAIATFDTHSTATFQGISCTSHLAAANHCSGPALAKLLSEKHSVLEHETLTLIPKLPKINPCSARPGRGLLIFQETYLRLYCSPSSHAHS